MLSSISNSSETREELTARKPAPPSTSAWSCQEPCPWMPRLGQLLLDKHHTFHPCLYLLIQMLNL